MLKAIFNNCKQEKGKNQYGAKSAFVNEYPQGDADDYGDVRDAEDKAIAEPVGQFAPEA